MKLILSAQRPRIDTLLLLPLSPWTHFEHLMCTQWVCRFLLRQKNALNIGNSTDKGSLRFFSFHSLCVHEFKGNKSWGNPQDKILRPSTRHGIWQPLTTASLFLLVAKVNRITIQTIRACKVWRQQFISHFFFFFSLASFTLFFSYKIMW